MRIIRQLLISGPTEPFITSSEFLSDTMFVSETAISGIPV